MKSLLLAAIFLLAASAANAALLTINWSSDTDPAGWNLYVRGPTGQDALSYAGTASGSSRSFPFHNITSSGLMQIGISRVEYVNDGGVNRRVEGPVYTVAILNGQLISVPDSMVVTSVVLDPNSN